MKSINWIAINVNNNGCGYIKNENEAYECSANHAECAVAWARQNGFECGYFKRHENNDVEYIFVK